MIQEDYCSFEVAKLLKEKGFDYQGFDYIDFEGEVIRQDRPTHQMAMKWLRDIHNINIEINFNRYGPNYRYKIIYKPEILDDIYNTGNYLYYEEAVEVALKYTLENLI